ncbi:MAG: hypothetical protein LBQ88_08925 [Treponema sp.]|nr:hypothetical protein [Treponema sp.]
MAVICPDCGRPVRYINAARGEDIYMVDVDTINLVRKRADFNGIPGP